jgi:hypothetical protein
MIAMSLPIGDAECGRLVAAVEEFCAMRRTFHSCELIGLVPANGVRARVWTRIGSSFRCGLKPTGL